jgi:hypothetical protein
MTGVRARRNAGVVLAVSMLVACSHTEPATPNTQASRGPAPLNTASASQLMDAVIKAGLPAPNRRDVTTLKCPELHCIQAIDTDTVSILKFPATGPAQLYAGSISNVYQLEDVVLTFAPTVAAEQKLQYERVVEHAAF